MTANSIKKALKTLIIGQSLMIETEKEILVGKLNKIDVNTEFIILESVKDIKNNIDFTTRQFIPLQTIKYFEPIKADSDDCVSESTATLETSSCGSYERCDTNSIQTSNASNESLPSVTLSSFEMQLLQSQLDSLVILRKKGIEYHKAIADIKTEQVVALLTHPAEHSTKTSLITVATVNALYIFDILSFEKLPNEIRALLDSETPRKALFCIQQSVDDFEQQHNVRIKGIFNTYATYSELTNRSDRLDLKNVVKHYFNDPDTPSLKNENVFNSYDSFQRPLQNDFLLECAKRSFFILKLQEYLEKEILLPFYQQCANFSRVYADTEDLVEMASTMVKHARTGIENNIYELHLTS